MNFEQSLFISYSHIDDQPLNQGEKGWITRFHATLKAFLDMRMGRDAKIWRDEKLQGNNVFSSEIVEQFRRSAALMSILTPRYLHSEWCTREAREFCEAAQQSGGLVIGNKSRVFKVIKTPIDDRESETLPAHMKDLLGFEFFTVKEGAPLELDPDYGPEYSQLYKQKVAVLAFNIAQLLETLQARENSNGSDEAKGLSESQVSSKPAVYLAECSYDRKPQREHADATLSATFSPDGARVVTASFDKTARVWDAATGEPIGKPMQHEDKVLIAAFSPDGARVVTASFGKTARVWDAARPGSRSASPCSTRMRFTALRLAPTARGW